MSLGLINLNFGRDFGPLGNRPFDLPENLAGFGTRNAANLGQSFNS